jgi:molybdopterin/thiamine biosynthesis adenylyltransferase
MQLLSDKAPMLWQASENWHVEQLSTRGRFAEVLTSRKVLLIGAGALGSPLAELLTRAGVQALTILDSDRLEAGNLARHTLGLDDLKSPKAAALAKHLNLTSPHASAKFIHTDFPPTKDSESAQVQQCEVILDCTGHDDVLYHLEHFPWSEAKRFFSISLGFGARRLFCFTAYEARFPHTAFNEAIEPWLQREREESSGIEIPREGIGCWHPVFPARADDIWMMAGIAAKYIESSVVVGATEPTLTVFEQQFDNGFFTGIRRMSPEATHA